MITLSNTITEKLEGRARARNCDWGILAARDNSSGKYFVVRKGTTLLRDWIALGWSHGEAKESLSRLLDEVA